MATMKMPCAVGSGGCTGETTAIASPYSSISVSEDHKFLIISLYRASSDPWVKDKNSTTVTPTFTSGTTNRLWEYVIPNVKSGDSFTSDYSQAFAFYLD